MSWQDRDYARVGGHVAGGARGGMGGMYRPASFWGGGLWGGSMVKKLIAANVILYFLSHSTGWGPPLLNGGVMVSQLVFGGQVWRLVTSQYLHADFMHILFNMMGLYFLGSSLERVWGNRKFFAIYTVAGLCGNLLLMVAGFVPWPGTGRPIIDPATPALGASGCVLGLLGAAAVMFPRAEILIYFILPVRIRTAALVFGGLYLFNIVQRGGNFGGDICHLAGMLFGAWWAWKGDRWWATRRGAHGRVGAAATGWSAPPRPNPQRGYRGTGTGKWAAKMATRQVDHQAVDRILKKVYDGGVQSLTPAERKTLIEATERQRQAEAKADRTERL